MLTAPVRDAPPRRKTAAPSKPAVWRQWLPRSRAGYAGAALVAALIGIVVNAVVFQRERHPAPFFAGDPTPPAVISAPAPAPPAPVAAAPAALPAKPAAAAPAALPAKPAVAEVAPPLPVARPAARPPAPATTTRSEDPIGELLRGKEAKDGKDSKTVAAVQTALVRAGYVLKADGVMGEDTQDALSDFAKGHGLPASSELTPKLLAKLGVVGH